MAKIKEKLVNFDIYQRPSRLLVPVEHKKLSKKIETVQGKSQSVAQLYQDFVLGRLDQSQIGGEPVYDDDDAQEVDPFNAFGVTLEETTVIADRGARAKADAQRYAKEKKKEKADKQKNVPAPPVAPPADPAQ